jgi:hypothetical protein
MKTNWTFTVESYENGIKRCDYETKRRMSPKKIVYETYHWHTTPMREAQTNVHKPSDLQIIAEKAFKEALKLNKRGAPTVQRSIKRTKITLEDILV